MRFILLSFYALISLPILSCAPISKVSGYVPLKSEIEELKIGFSTKNDVIEMLGEPLSFNKADADGSTILSAGTLDSGLVTKTADFEVISATNKSISILNFETVNDKDSSSYSSGSQNLFLNDINFQTNDLDREYNNDTKRTNSNFKNTLISS